MSDVIDLIDELNDHGFEDTVTSRKVGIINDTIADICSREPWPFLEKESDLTFNGSSAAPTNLPSDFSKVLGIQDTSLGNSIVFERWEVIRKKFGTQVTATNLGDAEYYYFVKAQPRIYPTPGASTTLHLEYVCFHPEVDETTLEAGILIPARHHRAITLGSLYKLYSMEDDPELAQVFEQEYEHRLSIMREDLIRVQYDSPDHIYVTDMDYYDDGPWWPY